MPPQKNPDYTPRLYPVKDGRITWLENAVENNGILEKSGVSDYTPFGMSMPERSWSLPDACNTYTSLYYDNVLDLDFENENGTWTVPNRNAGISFSSGNMYLTGYQDGGAAYTDFATETDSTYVITMNFSGVTGLATWNVSARDDQNNVLASTSITSLSTSPITLEFEAASTTSRLYISRTSGSGTIVLTIEDISIDGKYHKEDVMYLSYRYGFNNMEKDDELKGLGNSYDFGARIYDPRVGRWLAVDPLTHQYASNSSYCFAMNEPINSIDPNGEYVRKKVTKYYSSGDQYIEKKWFNVFKKTTKIEVSLTVYNMKLYYHSGKLPNGQSPTPEQLQIIADDIQNELTSSFNDNEGSYNGVQISVKYQFDNDIEVIENLKDVEISGFKPDDIIILVNDVSFYIGTPAAGATSLGGNVMLLDFEMMDLYEREKESNNKYLTATHEHAHQRTGIGDEGHWAGGWLHNEYGRKENSTPDGKGTDYQIYQLSRKGGRNTGAGDLNNILMKIKNEKAD